MPIVAPCEAKTNTTPDQWVGFLLLVQMNYQLAE